jgi:hypothetical protein
MAGREGGVIHHPDDYTNPGERYREREYDEHDYPPEPRRNRCQCMHLDMPGTCPGPSNCPMVEQEQEDEE